ncbi:hypothetical protein ACQZ46_00760 [Agrobacterium salinitolerans]
MISDPQTQSFSLGPLLQMAGVTTFTVRWPSRSDVLAIAMRVGDDAPATRIYAALLESLCGIPPAVASRAALAHKKEVNALFMAAFQIMRSEMPDDDPRLAESLPAALAGEK